MILMFFLGAMFMVMMGLSIAHFTNNKTNHGLGYLIAMMVIVGLSLKMGGVL